MKITVNIIEDLLPSYFADECSKDTKELVEEYLELHPDFTDRLKNIKNDLVLDSHSGVLNQSDEMIALKKIRRLLKWRSVMMGLAIFFSLVPFSFLYLDGKFYVLINEAPLSALFYGFVGLLCWLFYFLIRRKSNDI